MIIKLFFCAIGMIKMLLYKLINLGRIKFNCKMIIHPSVHMQIANDANLILGKGVSIRRNCEINVRQGAEVKIGDNTFFNNGCIITAHEKIQIGNNVEFGPNVMVFDHDHKFKNGYKAKEFECAEILIGDNVWVGAGTIILKGSHIGDGGVVAAGSIVKGDIPSGMLYKQKRKSEIMPIICDD